MEFIKGQEDVVLVYKGYKVILEHSVNLFYKISNNELPIYTICGIGRQVKGTIDDVKKFIDNVLFKYENY